MTETPENHQSADGAERESNKDIPPIVGPPTAAIPEFSPAQTKHNNTRKRSQWTKDKGMFWVTFAGVVAVVAYTSVAFWQARLTGRQLDVIVATKLRCP